MNPFPMGTGVKVWLSTGYTDMRCGFPSLAHRPMRGGNHGEIRIASPKSVPRE